MPYARSLGTRALPGTARPPEEAPVRRGGCSDSRRARGYVDGRRPPASASTDETVIVTATGLVNAVGAVLGVGGSILTQFHLINGVEAVIPTASSRCSRRFPASP